MTMEEERWKRVCPVLQDLVASAQGGLGREICEHFMRQIYERDGTINAVVESCAPPYGKDVRMVAKTPRPLEGLPFLVKDNIDVRGFHTVCGITDYVDQPVATQDCKIVSTLRELGAIPVGKTNTPAVGMDVQTFNDVFGTTCNPYNVNLSAGGSSGGSAAAVAIGMAPFAVGNDWNGSLRIPAAFCGVCSLRASRARMSADGRDRVLPPMPKDPEATGQILVMGVFTRSVADLDFCMRILLSRSLTNGSSASSSMLSEADQRESLPSSEALHAAPQCNSRRSSNVVGVAVSISGIPLDNRIRVAMRKLPSWLRASPDILGAKNLEAVIVDDFSLPVREIHQAMKIFSKSWTPMDPLDWEEHSKDIRWAKSVQARTSHMIDSFLERARLSAIIAPVCPILPPVHNYEHAPVQINDSKVSYWRAMMSFVELFTVSGNPVVTLPLCWIEGKPCGIQVVGKKGADEELLSTCVLLEQMIHVATKE